jgi:hypothetical protein
MECAGNNRYFQTEAERRIAIERLCISVMVIEGGDEKTLTLEGECVSPRMLETDTGP